MNILLLADAVSAQIFADKLVQSHHFDALFIASDNAIEINHAVDANIDTRDFEAIYSFCINQKIQLLIVEQNELLERGIVDFIQAKEIAHQQGWNGILVGPGKAAVQLLQHNELAKTFMHNHQIPFITDASNLQQTIVVLTNGADYQIIGQTPFVISETFLQKLKADIIQPTLNGFQKDGIEYHGFLSFDIMNNNEAPFLIRYSCRLGTHAIILSHLETDIVSLLAAMDNGTLADTNIEFNETNNY